MLSIQPLLRPRAGGVGPRPTGSMARLCFALCLPTSAVNRGSAQWFGRPRLKMKDRRRICRERKVLIMERVQHRSTGLKACSSLRAHPGMSRCVATGERGWMCFRLAMAVACWPNISKPRFVENSIGSNCFSSRSRLWRPSGTRCSTPRTNQSVGPAADVAVGVHGVMGRSSLRSSGLRDSSRHFDNRRQVAAYAGLAPTLWQSGSVNREQGISQSRQPATTDNDVSSWLAWLWLRHQPRSALTLWFQDRDQS